MSFKEDVKRIELPKELHERSKKGIDSSAREKKKVNHLKPALLTIIVTAAMLLFVFSQLNGGQSTDVTTAALKDNGLPPFAISIAYIVTVAAIIGVVFLWRKKRTSRLVLILSFLAIMSTTWITSLKYTYELLETELYPISIDISSDEFAEFTINYLGPKSSDKHILSLYFNDNKITPTFMNEITDYQPWQFRLFNTYRYVTYQLDKDEIEQLKLNQPINARVLFIDTDYSSLDVEIQSVNIFDGGHSKLFSSPATYEETKESELSTYMYEILENMVMEELHISTNLEGSMNWNVTLNDRIINLEEQLPLSLSEGDTLTIQTEKPKASRYPLKGSIYYIENNKKLELLHINQFHITSESYIESVVSRQRGEQREN